MASIRSSLEKQEKQEKNEETEETVKKVKTDKVEKKEGSKNRSKAKTTKVNSREKERKLIEKIDNAKKELSQLRNRRRIEVGGLACKHGLDQYDDALLSQHFELLSKTLRKTA